MEPIAACLALGDRLSWKMNDKYLVRVVSSMALQKHRTVVSTWLCEYKVVSTAPPTGSFQHSELWTISLDWFSGPRKA